MAAVEELRKQLDHILRQVAKTQNIENLEININTEGNYGDGFVGQFYTGDIRNKDTGETIALAIKIAPSWEYDYTPIYKNEDAFYSKIFPAFNDLQRETSVSKPFNHIPKYFCGSLEPKNLYIVMENLKLLGYVMFDKTQYLDKEHLEKIFTTYGKFHAISYVLRNKNIQKYQNISSDLTDLTKKLAEVFGKPMISAVSVAVKALDTESDKKIYEEIKDFGENVVETYLNATTYNGEQRCLVHGDCWSNNMLFKYSESGKLLDIKLVDFQLTKDSSPIHDLSYLFYSGASKRDFDILDTYLQIYHNSFTEFAKELGAKPDELLSFEVLRNEWKENALYGVIMGIYLWQVKLVPKKEITDVFNPNKEEKGSLEEDFKLWAELMDSVCETDAFRERTAAILRHAVEYGVLNKNKIVRNKK